MTGSVGFKSALINPANFFVAALYDTSNVSVVLESIQVPKGGGYPPQFQVTFTTSLQQDHLYRAILWESADTTPTGISRVSGDFKASLNSVTMRGDLYLTGGSDAGMTVGAAGYVDPSSSLAGWGYDLEQVGTGTLKLNRDYTIDSTTGDWTLINGTTIGDQQDFVIHFQPQISAAPQPSISAITSGIILTANTTLDSSYKNKAIYLQGAGSSITTPLPALSTVADYDYLVFFSSGGMHTTAIIPVNGTDKIQYQGLATGLELCQGETLKLFKANGVWNVDGPLPGFDAAGQLIETYLLDTPNAIIADGSLLDRLQYNRLYNRANAANAFVSEANWGLSTGGVFTNKGFFTQGTSSSNFRIPDLRVYGSLRAIDGTSRLPGSFQKEMVGPHDHTTHGKGGIAGSALLWFLSLINNRYSAGGGGDSLGGRNSVDTNMRTDDGTGTETRVNNTGIYRLIRI